MRDFLSLPEDGQFNGIITRFNNAYPDSWKKYVKAFSDDTNPLAGRDGCQSLVDRIIAGSASKDEWCSRVMEKGSFIISFPLIRIIPSSYSLQSGVQSIHSINWTVEASNDLSLWDLIDNEYSQTALKGNLASNTFTFDKKGSYKHFRFTQILGSGGTSSFYCLKKVEIFGFVKGSKETGCIVKSSFHSRVLLCIVILIS